LLAFISAALALISAKSSPNITGVTGLSQNSPYIGLLPYFAILNLPHVDSIACGPTLTHFTVYGIVRFS
jgi:hypothetical protein